MALADLLTDLHWPSQSVFLLTSYQLAYPTDYMQVVVTQWYQLTVLLCPPESYMAG